jgi:hypothetical protein
MPPLYLLAALAVLCLVAAFAIGRRTATKGAAPARPPPAGGAARNEGACPDPSGARLAAAIGVAEGATQSFLLEALANAFGVGEAIGGAVARSTLPGATPGLGAVGAAAGTLSAAAGSGSNSAAALRGRAAAWMAGVPPMQAALQQLGAGGGAFPAEAASDALTSAQLVVQSAINAYDAAMSDLAQV